MFVLALCLALGLAQPPTLPMAPVRPSAKLCAEAVDLLNKGKLNEGLQKLDEATKADPEDPQPHDITAQVYQHLAKNATPYAADYYREKAGDEAELIRLAKGSDSNSRVRAQVMLESIHQDEFPREDSAVPGAVKAFKEAEQWFHQKQFDKAREAYKQALELDPHFAVAALYVGDCYHAESKPGEAALWFRKATEIRPDYPKAWRYLSDGLLALGKRKEAESALLGGIAAHPGNRLTWLNLMLLRAEGDKPMSKLGFCSPVIPSWDEKGQQALTLPEKTDDPEGQAIWVLLVSSAMDRISIEVNDDQNSHTELPLQTRFQKEFFFWSLGLERLEAICKEKKQEPKDRILRQFLVFKRDGQLEPALFLLRYKEAFRPDFEAWKKKNPAGITAFLDRYNLRP